ncbi:MAG: chemotaxis-specific protein-glutamate methyltransferase CheB [Methylococcus sp.]|nr:MAG: chemotaxis-specific protein-glutamate methyltransferase CheB [Methylococcus sp.]
MKDSLSVLIIDDSRAMRAVIEDVLRSQSDFTIAGSVFSAAKAYEILQRSPPDIVTIDLDMPSLDGTIMLKEIFRINENQPRGRSIGVLVISDQLTVGSEGALKALQHGAFDVLEKPKIALDEPIPLGFSNALIDKIRTYSQRREGHYKRLSPTDADPGIGAPFKGTPVSKERGPIRGIMIAASTGGPKALSILLPEMVKLVNLPIFVVQHMPLGFTTSLAESLSGVLPWPVHEARDSEQACRKTVYIAPSGRHLQISQQGEHLMMGLSDGAPESGCKPSANVLYRSAAHHIGSGVLAIILTGMGDDGVQGLMAIRAKGGYVIAQDEATSVVWGMPGAAVNAGAADKICPLSDIPSMVFSVINGRDRRST